MSGGLSQIHIGERQWENAQILPVSSLQAAWEVSQVTELSCVISSHVAHSMGYASLLGLWVQWYHENLGDWGGVIEDVHYDLAAGTVELVASSFAILMEKKRTSRSFRTQSAPVGSLWLRAISDVKNDYDLDIDEAYADEGGTLYTLEWRGDDLLDLTNQLASNGAYEYDVTMDSSRVITAQMRERVGEDKRGKVVVIEGRDFYEGDMSSSIHELVNDILAVPSDFRWASVDHAIARDLESQDTYGVRQAVIAYDYVTRRNSLFPKAKDDLILKAQPTIPATITLSANNEQLSDVRQGDTINLFSATLNGVYDFRVKGRAYSSDTDSVTLSGDCIEEE